MREAVFKAWLVAQGYAPTSIATWLSDGRKVDGAYDLDEQFDRDGGASMLAQMAYSRSDEAASVPNPSAIDLSGSFYANLAACRAAARAYFRFRNSEARPQGRFGELDREAVLEAVAACDAVGDVAQYVTGLELGQPTKYWLVLDGQRYPSKAIVRDALAILDLARALDLGRRPTPTFDLLQHIDAHQHAIMFEGRLEDRAGMPARNER